MIKAVLGEMILSKTKQANEINETNETNKTNKAKLIKFGTLSLPEDKKKNLFRHFFDKANEIR